MMLLPSSRALLMQASPAAAPPLHSRSRSRSACVVASQTGGGEATSSPPSTSAVSTQRGNRTARLTASKTGMQDVPEKEAPLAQYMQLPASQYSVLDGRKVERISDTTFRCYVGQLKMLKWSLEPVLTLSVDVEPMGCTIKLLSCELKGSPFVEDLNNKFQAQMTNRVRYRNTSSSGDDSIKQITSDTELQVELEVPGWCGFISNQTIEGTGSGVLQNVLNLMVPRFLQQLQKDYELWASGDTSRKPVGDL